MTARTNSESVQDGLVRLHGSTLRGDLEAREQLIGRLYPVIRGFLRRRIAVARGCDALLHDLVQESMAKISTRISKQSFADDRHLLAWSLKVARNAAIDDLRRSAKRHATVLLTSEIEQLATVDSSGPDRDESAKEVTEILNEVLDRLDPEAHSLLWSRVVENSTWADVAVELGISVSAAKRRWQRLQQRLQAHMAVQFCSSVPVKAQPLHPPRR
jgi:RNA polymerase sigma factor (sigma-70 family)